MLRDLTLLFKPCCCHGTACLIRAVESKSTEWAAATHKHTHMYIERMPDWLPVSALTPGQPGRGGVGGGVGVGGLTSTLKEKGDGGSASARHSHS